MWVVAVQRVAGAGEHRVARVGDRREQRAVGGVAAEDGDGSVDLREQVAMIPRAVLAQRRLGRPWIAGACRFGLAPDVLRVPARVLSAQFGLGQGELG